MSIAHIGTIARLELTQRLRSVGWYVLLGVFAAVLLGVTALSSAVYSYGDAPGAGIFSIVVNMVLLLVVLVSPTLSGNAINGDRESATLAAIQVTAVSTGDIMLGKLVAAIATGGAFLLVALPFLAFSLLGGGADPLVLLISILVLAAEIVIVAAIGVGLSGLIARPLFSVATTYLVVAGLVIGTLIVFALGGLAVRGEATNYSRPYDENGPICDQWEEYTYEVPRFDLVWWALAANPLRRAGRRHAHRVRKRRVSGRSVRADQVRGAQRAAFAPRTALGRLRGGEPRSDSARGDRLHGAELVRRARSAGRDRRVAVRRGVVAHAHARTDAAAGDAHRLSSGRGCRTVHGRDAGGGGVGGAA